MTLVFVEQPLASPGSAKCLALQCLFLLGLALLGLDADRSEFSYISIIFTRSGP